MSIAKFVIPAGVMMYVGLNYSHIAKNTLSTVRSSVGTIELTRIDKALREEAVMNAGDAGAYGTKHPIYPSESKFKEFMRREFNTPGRNPTLDQWGNPWQYKRFKDGFRLSSYGPDGVPDTEDDLWLVRHGNKASMNRSLEAIGKVIDQRIRELEQAQKEAMNKLAKLTGSEDMINAAKAAAKLSQMDGVLREYMTLHDQELPSSLGAYLGKKLDDAKLDPWGRPYRFAPAQEGYRLSSDGPDGVEGTDDDIVVERSGEEVRRHHAFDEVVDLLASAKKKAQESIESAFSAPELPPAPDAESGKPSQPSEPTPEGTPKAELTPAQKKQANQWLTFGENFMKNQMNDKARRYFQKVVENFPGTPQAEKARKHLEQF